MVDESLLKRVKPPVVGQPFDGLDLASVGLHGEHQAGGHQPPVDDHGAGAAVAGAAALLAAGKAQLPAHHVQERAMRFHRQLPRLPVYGEANGLRRHGSFR